MRLSTHLCEKRKLDCPWRVHQQRTNCSSLHCFYWCIQHETDTQTEKKVKSVCIRNEYVLLLLLRVNGCISIWRVYVRTIHFVSSANIVDFFDFFFFFGLIKFLVLKHLRQMPLHHTHQSVQWETPCDIVIRKTVSKSFCLVDNNYLTNKHVIMWWTRNNLEYEAASNQRLFERGATRPTMSSHNHDVTQRRCGHRRQADARLKCLNQFT